MLVRAKFKRREELPVEILCCARTFSKLPKGAFLVDSKPVLSNGPISCLYCGVVQAYQTPLLELADGSGRVQACSVDLDEGGVE